MNDINEQSVQNLQMEQNTKIPESFRAFIAIILPPALQAQIFRIIGALRHNRSFRNVKWVKMENLHITLRFLGNINLKQYEQLVVKLQDILPSLDVFSVNLTTIQPFPMEACLPRALIFKIQPLAPLANLAIAINDSVARCGISADNRPFIPHLTIGRFKSKRAMPYGMRDSLCISQFAPLSLNINEVLFVRSIPQTTGSVYIPLNRFILGGK